MRAADAVINRPTQVPPVRRGIFRAVTLLAWSGFAWLLTPVATGLLWLFGLHTAFDTTVAGFGTVDPALISLILSISAFAASALLVWAEVQRRRFTGVERRRRAPDATGEEMADALGCDPVTATELRSGKVVSLRMREDGSPEAATPVRIPVPRRPMRLPDEGPAAPARRPPPGQREPADITSA